MNVFKQIVNEIQDASKIVITAHKSADGDSVGCSLGLLYFIEKLGKKATVCHPDKAPEFLSWLDTSAILRMDEKPEEVTKAMSEADLIFSLDYNAAYRLCPEMQSLLESSSAKKVMIDHHLDPEDYPDITVSDTTASSTAQLIVELIHESGNISLLDEKIGVPLYLGILTDTGNYRFPSVTPKTHDAVSRLLVAGVRHNLIHEALHDTNTESRLRLQGFAMSQKLEVVEGYKVSIIGLSKEELAEYNYVKGDTDNLANLCLSIKGMKVAIVFTERDGIIKISFRSKGEENAVNVFASENFNGGGHLNAAGGMSELSVEETIAKMKDLIPKYFSKN